MKRSTGWLVLVIACGPGLEPAAPPGPSVVMTQPAAEETAVGRGERISVSFSKPMKPESINVQTFTLARGAAFVAGSVGYENGSATLTPAQKLLAGTSYVATITTGMVDVEGHALAADHSWSFTTSPATAAPKVASTSPSDAAVGVSTGRKLTVIFSGPMEAQTEWMFTLSREGAAVKGEVSWSDDRTIATFVPDAALLESCAYTATILVGEVPYVWRFTTGACTQSTVPLLTAANFAVLAGSSVLNAGATSVMGDIGTSPGGALMGFPPGHFVGYPHLDDSTAVGAQDDLRAAYQATEQRSLCPRAIEAATLKAGLYRVPDALAIEAEDLRLDAEGDADAVFVFQVGSALTLSPGRKVLLVGGARAQNVYWQVGGEVTLGSMSELSGTVMGREGAVLKAGAKVNGRVLVRGGSVALEGNTITMPGAD